MNPADSILAKAVQSPEAMQFISDTKDEAARHEILQRRAQMLARVPHDSADTRETTEVLEFRLDNEYYAIESEYIREVLPLKEITPLPGTPSFVLGIINARGQILSVVDIKPFFGLARHDAATLNRILIVRAGAMEFGILADEVAGMRSVEVATIEAPPLTLTGLKHEFLKGVTPEGLLVLHAARLLSDSRIVVHEEVIA